MIDVEPLIRTHLDRLQPLPSGARQDWEDVLRQARRRRLTRRRIRVGLVALALVAAALGLFVAAPALGFLGAEPAPSWTWPEGVPGDPVRMPPRLLQAVAADRRNPVDPKSIREIVSVGAGEAKSSILAARGPDGDTCIAELELGGGAFSPFGCLHDLPPRGAATTFGPVVLGGSEGGHRGSVVDYVTVIGVARGDVGRVELELEDGETIELPLNRWRGFGYSTSDHVRFPKTLRVYRTWGYLFSHHSKLVADVPLLSRDVHPTPLCGEGIGPCPEGVKP